MTSSRAAFGDDRRASSGSSTTCAPRTPGSGCRSSPSTRAGLVGHVSFTRSLLDTPNRLVDVLVLSPLSVLPARQERGIGSALVRYALRELDERPEPLVFLEGSPAYYSRFGFVPAQGPRVPAAVAAHPAGRVPGPAAARLRGVDDGNAGVPPDLVGPRRRRAAVRRGTSADPGRRTPRVVVATTSRATSASLMFMSCEALRSRSNASLSGILWNAMSRPIALPISRLLSSPAARVRASSLLVDRRHGDGCERGQEDRLVRRAAR